MTKFLQSSLSSSDLFNQFETVSDRKNLCNVTFFCSNGMLYHNKLVVGLVFPVLERMEEFSSMQEVMVIVPSYTVQDIKVKIDHCFGNIYDEKITIEQKNKVKDKFGELIPTVDREVENIVNLVVDTNNDKTPEEVIVNNDLSELEQEEEFVKFVSDEFDLIDKSDYYSGTSESMKMHRTYNHEGFNAIEQKHEAKENPGELIPDDAIVVENIDLIVGTNNGHAQEDLIKKNVVNKVEEEEEFLKLVKYISDNSKLIDNSEGSRYQCNICEKTFKGGRVSQHVTRNHCTSSFQCPLCDDFIGTRASMKIHIANFHEDITTKGKSGYCSVCKKNITKLAEHTRRVHLKIKQHFCTLCEKGFFDKSDLDKHNRNVHEDKREICQECGLSFKKINTHIQNVHRKEHVKDICPECGKSFSNSELKEHIRSVHKKEKNISCPICPLKVFKKSTLKRHLAIHEKYASMNKPYLPPPKPEYNLENLELATGLVVAGQMSRRKAAKLFKLSVHDLKKSTLRATADV